MRMRMFYLLLAGFVICFVSNSFAGPTRAEKMKHADRNKDGHVDRKEMRMEKRWEHRHWARGKAKVNTAIEAKYDKNGDGYLQPQEVRELLKDRATIIKTDGKAKVDSAAEAEYDTNKDGVIDKFEAKSLMLDLGA